MKYVVDRIEENILVLENLETREIVNISNFNLNNIKEGDILIENNGVFTKDEDAKIERIKIIREKMNRLKRKE